MFDLFKISEDRLLDEPMGRALEAGSSLFEAGAEEVVDFDAKGSTGHGFSPAFGAGR
jgi:hypothetical protein